MYIMLLDLKDRKILFELDSNSRASCSQIAKKVGLSTEVVNYRIKRFEKEKLITQYQLILNLADLNIIQFKICLSLQHITSKKLDEIISLIKALDYVKWIVQTKGRWDMLIALEAQSLETVNTIKDEILSIFENYLSEKSISILVEAQTFNRNYLLKEKRMPSQRTIMKKERTIILDDIDMKLLKLLSQNARTPLIELASKIKLSPRAAHYRLKQLEKTKLIRGYKIALDYEKLGIKFYKTFIQLDNPRPERVKSLTRYLSMKENVIHNVLVLGNWDMEPEFEVYSEEEFNKVLEELNDAYSDIIKNIEILTITKEHKFVYF